jgi:hypothetical protein
MIVLPAPELFQKDGKVAMDRRLTARDAATTGQAAFGSLNNSLYCHLASGLLGNELSVLTVGAIEIAATSEYHSNRNAGNIHQTDVDYRSNPHLYRRLIVRDCVVKSTTHKI